MKATGKKTTKKRVSRKPDATPRKPKSYHVHFVLDEDDRRLLDETVAAGGFVSGGDGKGGNSRFTKTQFFRYCLHHINDNKEISLTPKKMELVDALIDAIADNRRPLDEGLEDIRALRDEFKPVAVNINQAAHRINLLKLLLDKNEITLEKCAKEMELAYGYLSEAIDGYYDEDGKHLGLKDYIKRADELLEPVRSKMEGVLDREDKILVRLII